MPRAQCKYSIFDMDGLLLDTEKFYTIVSSQIAGRFGKTFSWELKAKQMGKKATESATIFVTELGLQDQLTPEQFLKGKSPPPRMATKPAHQPHTQAHVQPSGAYADREEGLDLLFSTAELLPGAEKLLRHLHKHSVPMALATSSNKRHYELKTTQHKQLFSLFTVQMTGDDVTKGKPNPEIFLAAAAKFDPPAPSEQCLVFEDAPSGVQAAKAANMYCVMVPDSRLDPAMHAGADQVLASLEDFDPAEWGLPPYDS